MRKLCTFTLSLYFLATPLVAKKGAVTITFQNQSNIPITAIKKRFGCAKIIRGELTACSSVNIAAGGQTSITGSKPFNIAIHHQQKGKNLRFITKRKVKNGETIIFPSPTSFKVLKGKLPPIIKQTPAAPKAPTPPPAPPVMPTKPTVPKAPQVMPAKKPIKQLPTTLQEEIKRGKKLKPTEKIQKKTAPTLQEEIRKGVKLKPVTEAEKAAYEKQKKERIKPGMQKVLEERFKKMQQLPGVSAEEEEEENDEWGN